MLMGSSGSYEEHTTWVAATFPNMADAVEYRELAIASSKEVIAKYRQENESDYYYTDEPTRYDLGHAVRSSKVTYRILPVPFISSAALLDGVFGLAGEVADENEKARELNGFPRRTSNKDSIKPPATQVPIRGSFSDQLAAAVAILESARS